MVRQLEVWTLIFRTTFRGSTIRFFKATIHKQLFRTIAALTEVKDLRASQRRRQIIDLLVLSSDVWMMTTCWRGSGVMFGGRLSKLERNCDKPKSLRA